MFIEIYNWHIINYASSDLNINPKQNFTPLPRSPPPPPSRSTSPRGIISKKIAILSISGGWSYFWIPNGGSRERTLVCTGTVPDRPMRRILLGRFPLRLSSTTTTTPYTYTSLFVVGDAGRSPHSRATFSGGWSFRNTVVVSNASSSSLISFYRFLFAQPAKMVWITVDDQVYPLLRSRLDLLLLKSAICSDP